MRAFTLLLLAACTAVSQTPPPPAASASDTKIAIDAKLYLTRDEAKAVLGADPGPNVIILEVKITPKTPDGKMYLDHDEFLLRSDRNGERARPLLPSQLAGSSVMVISSRGGTQGAIMGGERRVPYGGVPGVPGDPRRPGPGSLPVPGQGQGGSATADNSEAVASIEEHKAGREQNLLLDALKDKILPDGEIDKPVSGLLYFNIEGKHRVKHLEFIYRKAPPRLSLRFPEPKKN